MKNFYFFLILGITISGFSQNIVINGDFETGNRAPWNDFNNQVLLDNLTSSLVGNVNNGEGAFRQDIPVVAEAAYTLTFDYRWVSPATGTGNYVMNANVIADSSTNSIGSLTLNTTPDTWYSGTINFTVPIGETDVRIVFYKVGGNRPFRLDNVVVTADSVLPCLEPTGVANPVKASTSAYFSWDSSASDFDGFDWAVTATGGDPDTPADVVDNSNVASGVTSVSVAGLTEGTSYDFYVRTRCEIGTSDWSAAVNFTPAFQENLILNSRFDADGPTADPADWQGYNNQNLYDDITGDLVGNVNNAEGSLFQIFSAVPGTEYALNFDYRWVSGTGNYDINLVIRDEDTNALLELEPLSSTPDQWFSKTFYLLLQQELITLGLCFSRPMAIVHLD